MFVRYLELDPEHDQSRLFLARIAAGQIRYDEALSWLSAVTSDEHVFDAQLRTAFVLVDAKRIDEALAHLLQIVPDSVPEQVRIYLAQERILHQSQGPEAALELLDTALIDVPGHGDLLYARGLVAAQLKLVDKHEADMRRLIELEPDNAHAYNALGYTLADQTDRLNEALVLIERALTLLPEDPFILDSMGWVHYRLGNTDLAREYLQKAIDLRMDAEIAAHLGEVLWMDGERDQARAVWQRGHEDDPDNSVLRETLQKFEP
jgi:tetratricopeptide (TPR) repeat protein